MMRSWPGRDALREVRAGREEERFRVMGCDSTGNAAVINVSIKWITLFNSIVALMVEGGVSCAVITPAPELAGLITRQICVPSE